MIDLSTLPPPGLGRGVERPQSHVAVSARYMTGTRAQDLFA